MRRSGLNSYCFVAIYESRSKKNQKVVFKIQNKELILAALKYKIIKRFDSLFSILFLSSPKHHKGKHLGSIWLGQKSRYKK